MTIGERIKLRREELQITQEDLASKLGLSNKASISLIEHSGDDVSMKNVMRIATALSTTPRFLMGYDEIDHKENRFITLNQVYHILKRDKEFDDRAIPSVFGYESEEEMLDQIRNHGPIVLPYSRIKEVASIYNLSPEYLMGLTDVRRPVSDEIKINIPEGFTTTEELAVLKAYRESDSIVKNMIKKMLDVDTPYHKETRKVLVKKKVKDA